MKEPRFLTLEQILAIHQVQLELFGGQAGIRDLSMLESALSMPESGYGDDYFHTYPFGMAAAYAFHIGENQPFIDGNKRTALDAALTFLEANGVAIHDPRSELFQAMIDLGRRRLSKAGIEKIFRHLARKK